MAENKHEERISKLEMARREMEDAMVVMAHLESKASARIKEHAEWPVIHENWIRSATEFQTSHALAMREFDEKLNALITIVSRIQGGMESFG